ncbi:tubulin--tyrosine ligase-like protein 12 [Anoplophora glabripennis]|uniref:tubulin--tyrosine ligase-like protein 12 n=1 Tax=Anoplophora glabripennis TaxID=217634 RepID=UPI0008755467|nr:tubulin--tyrosine ligase-like protein 12 [Anoplophora glabripennis]
MGHDSEILAFLNIHKDQLVASNIPQHFWNTLYKKLIHKSFNAGNTFQLLKLDYDQERQHHEPIWALQALSKIDRLDPKHIYLIDHAWTYRVEKAKQTLMLHDSLRERLCKMFDLNDSDKMQKEDLVDAIFNCMWKFNNMYTIGSATTIEDKLPVWYIMDEIGTSVLHNDNPNCRIVPFYYSDEQITYSLLFPIEDIDEADLIFRDFAEGITDPEKRSAFLLPWVPKSFRHYSIYPPMPGEDYFLSGHVKESLPVLSNFTNKESKETRCVLKVFTQYSLVKEFLTDNKFKIVENEDEADILWLTEHFKDFETLSKSPEKFVSQFPFEYVLTVKDLLCITCRRKNSVKWLPVTYNLLTEITNFVSYFQQRHDEGPDNYWIVKPCNLARSLDIHITDNLDYIMKLATTGPKIVQKYITNPVLFYRPERNGFVKFDIRYVILLKCVKPLEVFVYKEFFLRFANVPFELNEFDNYEKHFTVMNYTENTQLKHMKCEEFKEHWERQYCNYPWATVEKSIVKMLREILECGALEPPPLGIAENPQSRALYAADLMLEWTENAAMQPKILEVNFTPDCKRACDYYPDFYNDVFNLFFMNKSLEKFIPL